MSFTDIMRKNGLTGSSSQWGTHLSARKKMLTQKFCEIGDELKMRDGSKKMEKVIWWAFKMEEINLILMP